MSIPYNPKYIEHGVPYYDSTNLETYGLPDIWGIWRQARFTQSRYGVIESRETMFPLQPTFNETQNAGMWGRPVHRYIRTE